MKIQFTHNEKSPTPKTGLTRATCSNIGFCVGVVLLGTLTGCIVDDRYHARVYAPAPAVDVVVVDDYVYYPGYQVYYSSSHHNYIYLEGRSWVTRPAPPRVSVDVLFASPSVRVDFHDHPSAHHATIVRQYPQHWAPAESARDEKGNGRGRR